MPRIYQAANVQEAVAMAQRFKEKGTYDWFRGQAADYPPVPSLARRKTEEEIEDAKFQYESFISWAEIVPELSYLLLPENEHQLEAIMQHYGIPTNYMDFSTEPGIAGFFAADTQHPPTDRNSCIYCLSSSRMFAVWDAIKDGEDYKGYQLEKIIIDVQNLWRLQAQYGVFLLSNFNFEVLYPPDMISFPYTGYPSYPTRDIVYPKDKSALELLLDQYNVLVAGYRANRELEKVSHLIHMETLPEGIYADAFKEPALLKIHDSWNTGAAEWNAYKTERYQDTIRMPQRIRLNKTKDPGALGKTISYAVAQLIRFTPSIRNRIIEWSFEELPDQVTAEQLAGLLSKVWNGMRLLPFEDEEISIACGNTVFFFLLDGQSSRKEQLDKFSAVYGQSMRVGFSQADHAGSYGYASYQGMQEATTIDLPQLVKEEYVVHARDTRSRYQLIYNPRVLFDFARFRKLFATEIIPTQIGWNERLVLFNPRKLTIFGIP